MSMVPATRRVTAGLAQLAVLLVLSVAARSPEPEALRFAAMGDMGTGGPGQRRVAAMLAERARQEPLDFWLTLGDNIYPWGVVSAEDPAWEERFESVYADPALQVPVYPTLGNHDYLGLPLAQVERSRLSGIWSMPDRYYTFSRVLADGAEVAFFALDTEMILSSIEANVEDSPLKERMGMVRRVAARGEVELSETLTRYIAERVHVEDGWGVMRLAIVAQETRRNIDEALVDEVLAGSGRPDYPAQLAWLEAQLRGSEARWKIVFGHNPLYSHNPWREVPPKLRQRLEPILLDGGVDLYLAGHDHFLDMMRPVKGLHHVTSGGGSGDDEAYDFEETDASYYIATGGGFTLFRVTADTLAIEFVDLEGVTRHRQVLTK